MAEQYPSKPPDFKHREFDTFVHAMMSELRAVQNTKRKYLKFEDYHAALAAVYAKWGHYFGSKYLG